MPRQPLFLGVLALGCVLSACATKQKPPDGAAPARALPMADARCGDPTAFEVGAGITDITGPAAQVLMMGYVNPSQVAQGIHQRLRSRAFVIAKPCGKRAVFVSADVVHLYQAVKQGVVKRLREDASLKDARGNALYTDENVLLSATHTHSGPGGFSHYDLYNLAFRLPLLDSKRQPGSVRVVGFVPENYEAIVDGIYQSIVQAHRNLAPGRILLSTGELEGVSANRSKDAYALNPEADRQGRPDTDNTMTLLRLETGPESAPEPVGLINWLAIHPTSMNNQNRLINGDNKGYASYLFEKAERTDYGAKARTFVAAFAQSNEGDVTPNVHPEGPNWGRRGGDTTATKVSGEAQYQFARQLYEDRDAARALSGEVDFRHTYVDMTEVTVAPEWTDGEEELVCRAALGVSMLAGTEDGRGVGREGVRCGKGEGLLAGLFCGNCQDACHAEKPVVLRLWASKPPMTPEVLPLQLLRLGNLAVVAVPFEMTTMAGRKLREDLQKRLAPLGVDHVVIAGLSNAYAGYLATRREYARQDYEGASTHFGPWTHAGLRQEFAKVAAAMAAGEEVPPGPTPRTVDPAKLAYATLPRLVDEAPRGADFGDVVPAGNAKDAYGRGESVKVTFWGANPRNDFRQVRSFLEVQRRVGEEWVAVAHDWDWATRFSWARMPCPPRSSGMCSHATVVWDIPADAEPGTYRLQYSGRVMEGKTSRPFTGHSGDFVVR